MNTTAPEPVVLAGSITLFGTLTLPTEGTHLADVPGYSIGQAQGLVGELDGPVSVGENYVVSADITTVDYRHTGTFDLYLKNSSTGTLSSLIARRHLSFNGNNWVSISGTITADKGYDRVVIKTYGEGSINLVDNVRLCESAVQTIVCAPGATNLVQNPGFETLIGPGSGQWWGWQVLDPPPVFPPFNNFNPTQVPHWYRKNPFQQAVGVMANGNGFAVGIPAYDGTHFALMSSPYGGGSSATGMVGDLATSISGNTPFVLSARINAVMFLSETTIEMKLRNSFTGAESLPVAKVIRPENVLAWTLLSGVVTPNPNTYNQVVFYVDSSSMGGLVDGVSLCAGTVVVNPPHPSVHAFGWWVLLVGGALVAVVLMAAVIRRRFISIGISNKIE